MTNSTAPTAPAPHLKQSGAEILPNRTAPTYPPLGGVVRREFGAAAAGHQSPHQSPHLMGEIK